MSIMGNGVPENLESTYLHSFDRDEIFFPGQKLVAAFSGGADSVFLLYFLQLLKNILPLSVYAVHVNHHLRNAESDKDEAFCSDLCARWGLPFEAVHADVRNTAKQTGTSLEEAGRNIRYKIFEDIRNKIQADAVVTAHHRNDLIETMLYRMFRGTGTFGLTAIRKKQGKLIRPMLKFSKKQITEFLQLKNIAWREDLSNQNTEYIRNHIRHKIIPVIEEQFPSFQTKMMDFRSHLLEEEIYWDSFRDQCDRYWSDSVIYYRIDKEIFNCGIPVPAVKRWFRRKMREMISDDFQTDLSWFSRIMERVWDFEGNKIIDRKKEYEIYSSYQWFLIRKNSQKFTPEDRYVIINNDSEIDNIEFKPFKICFCRKNPEDKNKFQTLLKLGKMSGIKVRRRRNGDRLAIGTGKHKKLKDWFIDEKFHKLQRENSVIFEYNHRILSVFVPEYGFIKDFRQRKLSLSEENVWAVNVTILSDLEKKDYF